MVVPLLEFDTPNHFKEVTRVQECPGHLYTSVLICVWVLETLRIPHTARGQTLRVSSPPGALHAPPATPAVAAGLTATTVPTLSTALSEGKASGHGDATLLTVTIRAA